MDLTVTLRVDLPEGRQWYHMRREWNSSPSDGNDLSGGKHELRAKGRMCVCRSHTRRDRSVIGFGV